jgi:hypothetical protein
VSPSSTLSHRPCCYGTCTCSCSSPTAWSGPSPCEIYPVLSISLFLLALSANSVQWQCHSVRTCRCDGPYFSVVVRTSTTKLYTIGCLHICAFLLLPIPFSFSSSPAQCDSHPFFREACVFSRLIVGVANKDSRHAIYSVSSFVDCCLLFFVHWWYIVAFLVGTVWWHCHRSREGVEGKLVYALVI